MPPNDQNPTEQPVKGGPAPEPQPQPVPVAPSVPQPTPPAQPIAPTSPGMPAPAGPVPASADGQAKTKRLKGKVIAIIIAIVVIMVVGTIVAIFLLASSKTYNEEDLTTYSNDSVSFRYPESWIKADKDQATTVSFSDNKDVKKSLAAIQYLKTSTGLSASQQLTEAQKGEFKSSLAKSAEGQDFKAEIKKEAGCKDEGTLKVEEFDSSVLVGLKMELKCTNEYDTKMTYVGQLGLAKDNNVHAIGVTAVDSMWTLNQKIFQTMLDSLTVE